MGEGINRETEGPPCQPAYYVMLECRAGTWPMQEAYHTITWCSEDSFEEALRTVARLLDGDPLRRNVRRAWVDVRASQ